MTTIGPIAVSLPADVRAQGDEATTLYQAALGFEQLLVRQLAAGLAKTTDNDDEGGDASTSLAREQLPDALADGIASSGGLGLARTLYDAMREQGA